MRSAAGLGLFVLMTATLAYPVAPESSDEPSSRPTVVLLHGLARSASSMHDLARALEFARPIGAVDTYHCRFPIVAYDDSGCERGTAYSIDAAMHDSGNLRRAGRCRLVRCDRAAADLAGS